MCNPCAGNINYFLKRREKTKKVRLLTVLFVSVVLSTAVQASLNDGLVAYYPLNGNADDSSGNNLHGIAYGVMPTQDRFGLSNSAFAFDGQDDYIIAENRDGLFNLTSYWTLSAWVKPLVPSSQWHENPIVIKRTYGTTNDSYALAWGCAMEDIQLTNVFQTGLERASDDKDFPLRSNSHEPCQWYHVVGTYNNNSIKIYVNGQLEGSEKIGSVIPYVGSTPLTIGYFPYTESGSFSFNGLIDEVRIYNRALSDSEVTQLYNVPEPATLLLLGLGGLLLRRKKQ